VKNGRTTRARKKWTFLFGILAILGLGFCGYEFWQWVLPFWQPPSATGSFSVSSAPIGAVVHWKGHDLGHTPLKQCVLPSGDQVIEITAPGYQPCPIELTVRTGAFVDLGVRSLLKQLGKLRLVTDPAGISYSVVGPDKKTIAGVTPDTIENLPLGKYDVKLIEPGWPAYAQTTDVNSSNPVEVNREFKGGNVELTSDPAGATIYVGGSKLGTAPLTANLPLGPVEVTSRFGTLVSVMQTLVPDAQRAVSFHFKHSYGTLLVSSDRADSVLIVDGVDYGRPPAQLFLPPGNHKLLLSAPSAPDKTRRVDLLEGQHVNVQINFGPMVGEAAAVSNANASPTPTPASSASVTSATPASTPRPVQLAAQPTPTPTPPPAATPVPESNRTTASSSMPSPAPENSASGSEEQPAIPPVNVKANRSPTPYQEEPKPVRTLTRSASATKRLSAAVAATLPASSKPEPAKSKKEAFQVLDSHMKAKEEALNLEKQTIEYQIKNSSGSVREQWKYRLAQWRVKKARVEQDRAAEETRLNEQWK
jgi:PEGA domain